MKSKILKKYAIAHSSIVFGSGKATPVNKRCRRQNKKSAKLRMNRDFDKEKNFCI